MISAPQVPAPPGLGMAGGYPPQLPVASAAGSNSAAIPGVSAPGGVSADLKQVAQGFEAMLLRQMLAAAGKASFGGDELLGSDDTFTEMRNARFADLAAAQGTLGLAAQIEAQLARQTGAAGQSQTSVNAEGTQ